MKDAIRMLFKSYIKLKAVQETLAPKDYLLWPRSFKKPLSATMKQKYLAYTNNFRLHLLNFLLKYPEKFQARHSNDELDFQSYPVISAWYSCKDFISASRTLFSLYAAIPLALARAAARVVMYGTLYLIAVLRI